MLNYTIKKRNLLIIGITTAIVLYFTLGSEITGIFGAFRRVNPFWILTGIAGMFLFWVLEAGTFHLMLKTYDKNFGYPGVLKLVVTTQFFNGITPFSTGGQPFQIFVLTRISKIRLSSATSASIHNFIVYQCILVLMGALAIILHGVFKIFPDKAPELKWIALGGFGLNLLVITALIIIAVSPPLTARILGVIIKLLRLTPLRKKTGQIEKKASSTVEEFHKDIKSLMAEKQIFFRALGLNFLKLLIFYSIAYFVSLAVGFDRITFLQAVVACAYVMLITSVIPLPGASGGAELGFLVFFGTFVAGAQGRAIMLIWRFLTYYLGLIAGFFTFYFGYTRKKKKQESQQPPPKEEA